MKSVYSAVRTEVLNKTVCVTSEKFKLRIPKNKMSQVHRMNLNFT